MALPIKSKKAPLAPDDDVVANHPNQFTVRALWSSLSRNDVPQGSFGIQVKKESSGEVKFLLISVDDFRKHVHPPIMIVKDLSICTEWNRK